MPSRKSNKSQTFLLVLVINNLLSILEMPLTGKDYFRQVFKFYVCYSIKSFPTCPQNCMKAQTVLKFISLNFLLNSTPYIPYFPYFSAFFTLQIGICFLCGPTDVLQAWAVHPSSDIDCNCPTPHPLNMDTSM